eukprot:GEMP01079812.1.p1 GENE.GEMP01079812.1~~GEMP01079812.1.p1  ORF type:complete len:284 (+),score=65.46 GEMP01079812.1:192-1043(+)
MTHLVILRGWPPNVEVLMQARSSDVSHGDVYGLPGGSLDGVEKQISNNGALCDELRWRIRRRAALREACKFLGNGPNHEFSLGECIFPHIDAGNGQELPHEIAYSCIPARLREDFVNDVGTSVCFAGENHQYYFLYHLDGDSVFFRSVWQPRASPEFRWKVDETQGTFGYLWQPLERALSLPLCPWIQSFFLNFDVQEALRYWGPGSAIFERPFPAKTKQLTAKGKGGKKGSSANVNGSKPYQKPPQTTTLHAGANASEHATWAAWEECSWWNSGWDRQDWTQ